MVMVSPVSVWKWRVGSWCVPYALYDVDLSGDTCKFTTDAHHSPTLVEGNCPLSLLVRLVKKRLYRLRCLQVSYYWCQRSPECLLLMPAFTRPLIIYASVHQSAYYWCQRSPERLLLMPAFARALWLRCLQVKSFVDSDVYFTSNVFLIHETIMY